MQDKSSAQLNSGTLNEHTPLGKKPKRTHMGHRTRRPVRAQQVGKVVSWRFTKRRGSPPYGWLPTGNAPVFFVPPQCCVWDNTAWAGVPASGKPQSQTNARSPSDHDGTTHRVDWSPRRPSRYARGHVFACKARRRRQHEHGHICSEARLSGGGKRTLLRETIREFWDAPFEQA